MTPIFFRTPAALLFSTALLASSALAQTRPTTPQSPYGGVTVEDIVARVNDQIITQSDYDRAMKEMDDEAKQRGATMQQISETHKDLLRDLIDRQLWLSKGKELSITGETELIKRLDEIRKQYNMETLEDLEKAAKQQGVSFEDFKANIRNQIITQEVMREQVGRRVQFTPGEAQRYFDQHKQEYAKPESVELSEILVSTGADPDDAAKIAAGKAKADDLEAKLHAGGDFSQLAKSFSDGTTAADGGAFGTFHQGELAKVFEDATFGLKAGEYTNPIRTKQGYIIFKVDQHIPGGVPAYKDVEQEVEQNYYESRMEPAMRAYLTQMREEAYIYTKDGFVDSGKSTKQITPIYSVYTPPVPKKKKKVERTRFRETTRTFRQKSPQAAAPAPAEAASPAPKSAAKGGAAKKNASLKTEKPGKKEKIRFGQAPTKTLPAAASSTTEDAGAVAAAPAAAPEPANPLEASSKATEKTRFSSRAKTERKAKVKGPSLDSDAPPPPDAAEIADRQQQAAALGLNGDTSVKKKTRTTSGEKTRLTDKNKKAAAPDANAAPAAAAPPAPPAPASQPSAPQP
ncbi:MAG: peptidylprolyl isomerase [Terracidiphilus sp.]|nr:peptidylprolyl isomerase [Terracidiphilus sp.]